MDRRDLIQLLSAVPALGQGARYTPRFFTEAQNTRFEALAEALLPSEPGSPGAREAQVSYYVDTVLLYADEATKAQWRQGMDALEASAFARLCENEMNPRTESERFFVAFKRLTLEAFFQSERIQREFFGYKGNAHLKEFPSCPG